MIDGDYGHTVAKLDRVTDLEVGALDAEPVAVGADGTAEVDDLELVCPGH